MERWQLTAWARALAVIRLLAGPVFALSAGYALWACLRGHVGELIQVSDRPQAGALLTAALAAEFCGLYLSAQAFRQASSCLGSPLGRVAVLRVFSAAMLGKYVPGPTWSAVASVRLGNAAGVPSGRMVAIYLLSSAVALVTAVTAGLLAAPSLLGMRLLWLLPVLAAACCWSGGLASSCDWPRSWRVCAAGHRRSGRSGPPTCDAARCSSWARG